MDAQCVHKVKCHLHLFCFSVSLSEAFSLLIHCVDSFIFFLFLCVHSFIYFLFRCVPSFILFLYCIANLYLFKIIWLYYFLVCVLISFSFQLFHIHFLSFSVFGLLFQSLHFWVTSSDFFSFFSRYSLSYSIFLFSILCNLLCSATSFFISLFVSFYLTSRVAWVEVNAWIKKEISTQPRHVW